MELERIDFISAYCDSWCERCAFTTRCSAYAVKAAIAMCDGDFHAALELAVGAPPPRDAEEQARREDFLQLISDAEPSEQELTDIRREMEERRERIDESALTTMATMAVTLARAWLTAHRDGATGHTDPRVAEAIEVAGWDCHLIGAKVHRALNGRDQSRHGLGFDEDPVQNDWNGSAKVALISMRRSARAWDTIAQATGDPDAAAIAAQLRTLRAHVEQEFPDAWTFIRPGFDERK